MGTAIDKEDVHRIINLMGDITSKMTDRQIENLLSWCQGLSCKIEWKNNEREEGR